MVATIVPGQSWYAVGKSKQIQKLDLKNIATRDHDELILFYDDARVKLLSKTKSSNYIKIKNKQIKRNKIKMNPCRRLSD